MEQKLHESWKLKLHKHTAYFICCCHQRVTPWSHLPWQQLSALPVGSTNIPQFVSADFVNYLHLLITWCSLWSVSLQAQPHCTEIKRRFHPGGMAVISSAPALGSHRRSLPAFSFPSSVIFCHSIHSKGWTLSDSLESIDRDAKIAKAKVIVLFTEPCKVRAEINTLILCPELPGQQRLLQWTGWVRTAPECCVPAAWAAICSLLWLLLLTVIHRRQTVRLTVNHNAN